MCLSAVSSRDSDDPESPFIDVEALSDDDDDVGGETTFSAPLKPTKSESIASQASTNHAAVEKGEGIVDPCEDGFFNHLRD